MATYFSPGVYVKEIPSGSAPIAGAGTSTAAFIGVIDKEDIIIPTAPIIEAQEEIQVVKELGLKSQIKVEKIKVVQGTTTPPRMEMTFTSKLSLPDLEEKGKLDKKQELIQDSQKTKITLSIEKKELENVLKKALKITTVKTAWETDPNMDLEATIISESEIKFNKSDLPDLSYFNSEDITRLKTEISVTIKFDCTLSNSKQINQEFDVSSEKWDDKVNIKIIYDSPTEFTWSHHPGQPTRKDISNFFTWEIWNRQEKLGDNTNLDKIEAISKPQVTDVNSKIKFSEAQEQNFTIKYRVLANQVTNEEIKLIDKIDSYPNLVNLELKNHSVNCQKGTFRIKINGEEKNINQYLDVQIINVGGVSKKHCLQLNKTTLKNLINTSNSRTITIDYQTFFPEFEPYKQNQKSEYIDEQGKIKLCTNFNEFKESFGGFSADTNQKHLAHVVYGFFNNGGTRCYVVAVKQDTNIKDFLEKLEAIDEISIVVAPGIENSGVRDQIITHCQQTTGDRFAILDCGYDAKINNIKDKKPNNSNYAASYYPWIQVFDPATKTMNPEGDGLIYVPPSGHIAGIYARVDAQRGVHKAPANEVILGALGLKENISKNQQDGLNDKGINCIRNLNGNIRVWGARTIGGDSNGEFKYINVRRVFNYLKKSIDQGTQWTVFEPNSPELWAKIRRNVTAFLTIAWRDGALFGSTPEQAFYVKCDEETNPIQLRNEGQVNTEIGVSIVKPAEFVIFNLSQWAGPGK